MDKDKDEEPSFDVDAETEEEPEMEMELKQLLDHESGLKSQETTFVPEGSDVLSSRA